MNLVHAQNRAQGVSLTLPDFMAHLIHLYIRIVCTLLVVTALAKVVSAFGDVRELSEPALVFPFLSTKTFYILTSILELFVVVALLKSERTERKLFISGMLGTTFLAYKCWLYAAGISGYCGCLGNAVEWINISPEIAAIAATGMGLFMSIGSTLLLLLLRVSRSGENPIFRESFIRH